MENDRPANSRLQALVLQASAAYTACAMSTQYTIRSVPDTLDRAVRQRAHSQRKSINAVVVEALARGMEIGVEHTDLDHLIGTWQEDPGFDRAVADFGRVDEDDWR